MRFLISISQKNMDHENELKKYELHCHTHFSPCSNLKAKNILKICYKKNLDGIAIVDHNSIKGNREAANLNKKLVKGYHKDFEIVFADEVKTQYGDVLVYFMQEEIKTRDFYELCDQARQQDALVIVAHPFRMMPHLCFRKDIREIKELINGVEIYNSRTGYFQNKKAEKIANELKLAKTVGSDAHFSYEIGQSLTLCKDNLKREILKQKVQFRCKVFHSMLTSSLGTIQTSFHKRITRKFLSSRI